MQVNTPSLLAWYNEWQGHQSDDAVLQLPYVTVKQLLQSLGVPPGKMRRITTSLTESDLPVLRSLVLPSFVHSIDNEFRCQLEGFKHQSAGSLESTHAPQAQAFDVGAARC